MSMESKTITLKNSNQEKIALAINNQIKLGWELVSSSTNSGRGYHDTIIIFKRNTDIPFYERKRKIEFNIEELETVANKYMEVERKRQEKQLDRELSIGLMLLSIVADIVMVLGYISGFIFLIGTLSDFSNVGLKGVIISFILLGISIGITYLKINNKNNKSPEMIKYDEIIEKMQEYYDEAGKLN